MTKDSWLDEHEQRAWRSFLGMQTRLRACLAQELQRESGLSMADYEVLVILSESPHGRLRPFEIGRATGWEKSRLSHHLTRMAGRDLIRREACPTDPRYFEIVLTDAGHAAIVEAAPRHVAHVRAWFIEALTPDQLAAFAEACDAVTSRLDERPAPDCSGCGGES